MTKVICISGKARHGKDTAATILKEQLEQCGESVLIAHYADLVKYVCAKFFDWDGVKDGYGRTLLQRVGTDIVRTKNPGYWVDFIISILDFFPDEWDYVLIPDCRFPNEIEKMKEKYETLTVRVTRAGFENELSEEQKEHPSETSLDNYKFDYYLENPGTIEGLTKAVDKFIKENS